MSEKEKTIFRVEKNKDNPFVMIDRRPLENSTLSWKSKGILAYLLSRPDNWIIRLGDLVKHSPDGAHAVRQALKELRKAGHIHMNINREGGHVKEWTYNVFELPREADPSLKPRLHRDFQQVENQQVENRALNNTESSLTDNDSNDIKELAPDGAPAIPPEFPVDWQIAAGVEEVVIPDVNQFEIDARSWAHLIAQNNADLEPLAFEFMMGANKLPAEKDIAFWRKTFRGFRNMQPRPATAEDIRKAIGAHVSSKLSIKSPKSIEWALIEIISPTPRVSAETKTRAALREFFSELPSEVVDGNAS